MRLALAIMTPAVVLSIGMLAYSFADDRQQDDESQIEQIIKSGTAAFNSGDFQTATKVLHPTEYTTFGSSPQGELAQIPRAAIVELLEAITPALGQVKASEPIDLKVQVHGDAAVATYLRKTQMGEKRWATIRMTGVYFRIDGEWLLVHEHQSMLM